MDDSKYKNQPIVLIDWTKYPGVNPQKPTKNFAVFNEVRAIEREVFRNTELVNNNNTIFIDWLSNRLTQPISPMVIWYAKREYDKICKEVSMSPEDLSKRYPNVHLIVTAAYDALAEQHPEEIEKYKKEEAKEQSKTPPRQM